jgi:hypothetical protein
MKTTQETQISTGEITNNCTCTVYDSDSGEYTDEPAGECFGDCWEYALEDFGMVTQELRDNNDTNWWHVENLQLWNRRASGLFHANNVLGLLEGMTVRSDWTMRYTVFSDRIEYSLSHHDAPMGSNSTLRAVTEEQREEWGLY